MSQHPPRPPSPTPQTQPQSSPQTQPQPSPSPSQAQPAPQPHRPRRRRPRFVHLALADARGHLMRAQVLREVMATRGVDVDVVTTDPAGHAFLQSLGTPSLVLPGRFHMELGPRHDFQLGRTRRRLMGYAIREMLHDVAALRELARGAAFVVNDSFHPALLSMHRFDRALRVVHVHGENLRASVVAGSRPFRIERWLAKGFAEITHTLADVDGDPFIAPRRALLPPIVALPRPTVSAPAAPSVAVYLNPHYRERSIAELVERAARAAGLRLVGVSEAFAGRAGWRAADAGFIDDVAGADVFLSGAGMGALEQARVTGTPLVCLLGRQEEQDRNARERGLACVSVDDPDADVKLAALLGLAASQPRTASVDDARREIARVQSMWADVMCTLLEESAQDDRERSRLQVEQRASWLKLTRRRRERAAA